MKYKRTKKRMAIQVTKALGLRYLWVDRYCIHQNDPKDVKCQIAQMDQIYRKAEIVIIAASDQDGLPGVGLISRIPQKKIQRGNVTIFESGPDPGNTIRNSKWFTRAWTFQEAILARRRLYFTNYQFVFEGGELACNEFIGGPEITTSLVDRKLYSMEMGPPKDQLSKVASLLSPSYIMGSFYTLYRKPKRQFQGDIWT